MARYPSKVIPLQDIRNVKLIYCGLVVMPYGDKDLGQHWLN